MTAFITFFILLLNLILGIVSILKSENKRVAYPFTGIILASIIWGISIMLIDFQDTAEAKVYWARFSFFGPIFIPYLLFDFVLHFPNRTKGGWVNNTSNYVYFGIIALGTLFINLALFSDQIISGGQFIDKTIKYSYGSLYIPFFLYFIVSIGFSLGYLFRKYLNSAGLTRLKIKYVLTGFIISVFFALLFNMILPILGIDQFSNLGPISLFFLFAFTSYSVMYHRLFDIGTFMAKVIKNLLVGAFLFLVVYMVRTFNIKILNVDFYDPLNLTVDFFASLLVAIVIAKIINVVNDSVDRLVSSNTIAINKLLTNVENEVNEILDFEPAVNALLNLTNKYFPTLPVSFYDLKKHKLYEFSETKPKQYSLTEENSLKELNQILVTQELIRNPLLPFLESNKIAILSKVSEDLFLIFGKKPRNEAYSKSELDNIEVIVNKLETIFSRINYHQKIKDFNATLQTKVNEQTKQLERKMHQIQKQAQKERDMLDILGHELRTPLTIARNAISLNKTLLENPQKNHAKIVQYTDVASENIDREIMTLETLLAVTKIDNKRMEINPEKVDLLDVVNDSFAGLEHKAKEKGLQLISKISKSIYIKADRAKIQEVSDNLIDNAIKYTQKGSVTISMEKGGEDIKMYISDTGVGIPEDEIKHLGKKFYRVNNYIRSGKKTDLNIVRPGGTGLGLYVTFTLIKLMDGNYEIESTVGKGTTFILSFKKWIEPK